MLVYFSLFSSGSHARSFRVAVLDWSGWAAVSEKFVSSNQRFESCFSYGLLWRLRLLTLS